jgi:hypothetical protein
MHTSMNGKKIAAVYWPDTDLEQSRRLVAGLDCDVLTYHGDQEEFWIVQTTNGIEVARHNPRYVESIVWE